MGLLGHAGDLGSMSGLSNVGDCKVWVIHAVGGLCSMISLCSRRGSGQCGWSLQCK